MRQKTSYTLFFFNDTATTEIYTLSLHDALPIWERQHWRSGVGRRGVGRVDLEHRALITDRKSTRLNSSHLVMSYAVFCLKKKKRGGHPRFDRAKSTQHEEVEGHHNNDTWSDARI